MTIVVRRATAEHVEGRAILRAMLWSDETVAAHAAEIVEPDKKAADHVAFVAIDGTTVVGFAEASIRHEYVNGCDTCPVAFLEGIAVHPEYRKTGVARALTAAVEQWGRGQGCTELGSDADEENGEGQAFHHRLGFEERERIVCYRKKLDDVPNGNTLS